MGSMRWGLWLLGAGCVSSAVGCVSAAEGVAAQTTLTQGALPTSVAKESATDLLARDAELGGNEHHVSLLEGKIAFKVHAVETPEIKTASTPKGLLYSTIHAKVGPEQTVHCVAYASVLWPAGLVAADLKGEHDWANDGSEVPDEEAKTTSKLTRLAVSEKANRPVLSARATVRDASESVVADRKIIVTTTPEVTFSCSDRTPGFDKRFTSFVDEIQASMKVEPPALATKRAAIYRISGPQPVGTVGFLQVTTYVDAKGISTTYTAESTVQVANGVITGFDGLRVATGNARGEETEIADQVLINTSEALNVTVTRDAKGWKTTRRVLGVAGEESRLPAKTQLVSVMSPAWTARVRSVAAKKAGSVKLPLFSMKTKGGAPVIAKRVSDGTVGYTVDGHSHTFSFDKDGVTTWIDDTATYERIHFEGQK